MLNIKNHTCKSETAVIGTESITTLNVNWASTPKQTASSTCRSTTSFATSETLSCVTFRQRRLEKRLINSSRSLSSLAVGGEECQMVDVEMMDFVREFKIK